jgi:hypothetical protein
LATSTEHFFATSAVTDDSLFVAEATLMQINPANALANFSSAKTTISQHRGEPNLVRCGQTLVYVRFRVQSFQPLDEFYDCTIQLPGKR